MNRSMLCIAATSALLALTPVHAAERVSGLPEMPRAAMAAPSPASGLVAPALPAAAMSEAAGGAPAAAPAAAASAEASLQAIGAQTSAAAASQGGEAAAVGALEQRFDGAAPAPAAVDGGSGSDGGGSIGRAPESRSRRVVMILDSFDGPAPQSVVKHIETLLDSGSHVVFITARPYKGSGSAEVNLLSQLKPRMNNPLIVVSYNGAQVTPHAPTRSEAGPKPLIDNLDSFPEASLTYFRKSNEAVRRKLGLKEQVEEFGYPTLEAPFIYGGRIPEGASPDQWAAAYNRLLRSAGYLYKVETFKDAEGRAYFLTQSTALKLNTARVFKGLYAQFPQLDPAKEPIMGLKSHQVIVFGNPATAPTFMRSLDASILQGEGFYLQGVAGWEGLDKGLGSLLGVNGFDKVYVNRYDVRDYVEWRDRRSKFGTPGAGGGSGRAAKPKGAKTSVMTPFEALVSRYRGTVIKHVIDQLIDYMRRGNYAEATPEAAQELLKDVWSNPRAHRIFVDPEIELAMSSDLWRARLRNYKGGPVEVAAQYLRNFYHRNFPNYPRGVGERVAGVHLALARDGKQSVNLHYPNPHTGQDFVVGVKLDHQEIEEDDKGYILVAHVYRTGREPYFREFYEGVETSIAGRAMLEAWAEKRGDGRWYVNGEADPRVKVVFHYNTRDLPKIFTAAELDATVPAVASIITQREADPEYQAWLAEKQARVEKAKLLAMKKLGRVPKNKRK